MINLKPLAVPALAVVLLAACASVEENTPAPTQRPDPTPLIIYVTPEPTAIATVAPTPAPAVIPDATPVPVAELAVSGPYTIKVKDDRDTKPFTIVGDAVTLRVKATGSKLNCRYGLVGAFLYPAGETIDYEGMVELDGCGTNETEIIMPTREGRYYLSVIVANVTATITVSPY